MPTFNKMEVKIFKNHFNLSNRQLHSNMKIKFIYIFSKYYLRKLFTIFIFKIRVKITILFWLNIIILKEQNRRKTLVRSVSYLNVITVYYKTLFLLLLIGAIVPW